MTFSYSNITINTYNYNIIEYYYIIFSSNLTIYQLIYRLKMVKSF